jgi:hypothetical protein
MNNTRIRTFRRLYPFGFRFRATLPELNKTIRVVVTTPDSDLGVMIGDRLFDRAPRKDSLPEYYVHDGEGFYFSYGVADLYLVCVGAQTLSDMTLARFVWSNTAMTDLVTWEHEKDFLASEKAVY